MWINVHRVKSKACPNFNRLVCSLYRLKQAGWVWNRTFAHTIKRKLGVYVLCHHHKRGDSETDMILILYVNNLLLLGEDLSKIEDIKCQLGKCIKWKILDPPHSIWGFKLPETEILEPSGLINKHILKMHQRGLNFLMQPALIPRSHQEFIWRNPKNLLPSTPRHITNR